MITCRPLNSMDIEEGLRLCRLANWNQVARDWQMFLRLNPDSCRAAVSQDKVIGTVATVSYQRSFSWIGLVLVDKANQRQGLGRRLMVEALHILQHQETIKLDATPAGRAVYQKMDFADEFSLSRMNRITDGDKLPISTAKPIDKSDFPDLTIFDSHIFGASRAPLLEWMWEGAPQFAFIAANGNKIQGYCLGRQGYDFIHIGPVVALDLDTAKNVVSAALANCKGKPVILDALHFEPEFISWLEKLGFQQQRLITRMFRGANRFPGIPEKQFAILGPEFG